jgi:sRNA-binding carbon storage regulator CsrA
MLLLMRRVGEIIRVNEKITLRIKEIHATSVTFVVEDLNKTDQEITIVSEEEEKI